MTHLAGIGPKLGVFLVAMVLGGSVAYVTTAALDREDPASVAVDTPDFLLDDEAVAGAVLAAFDLVDAQQGSTALAALPPEDLALAAAALLGSGPVTSLNPLGFPRVPPVTQFDGGPFASANCTLAAGAMLARLGFGIVTTGSILRTLQDDQVGGTGLDDLNAAVFHGYGVSFHTGSIMPTQLKDLLSAGYGAVIQGDYSKIPPALGLQPGFTGGHAIYLDGFYPGGGTTPPAYYVIDPIGHGGYDGDWWPASVVDAFAVGFGAGERIAAAWAFPPGGTAPDVVGPDVLPLPSSGGDGTTPTPGPGESPTPGDSPGPSAPGPPELAEPGDISVSIPEFDPPVLDAEIGGLDLIAILTVCLFEPKPLGCPTGIEGVFELPVPILQFPLGPDIEIRFVDSDRPNSVLIGFTVDPGAPVDVRAWEADGSPAVVEGPTSMSVLTLLGEPTYTARLDLLASTTYHFQVVAGDGLFASSSPIGTFTTGNGVAAFDVTIASVANAAFDIGTGLSPYLHLAPESLVQPYVRADIGSPPPGCLDRIVEFGDVPFCLPAADSYDDVCHEARVTYELVGVEASAVLVRAFPTETGELPGGVPTLDGILESEGPAGEGEIGIGCLIPGFTYTIVIDAVGDSRGDLMAATIAVP